MSPGLYGNRFISWASPQFHLLFFCVFFSWHLLQACTITKVSLPAPEWFTFNSEKQNLCYNRIHSLLSPLCHSYYRHGRLNNAVLKRCHVNLCLLKKPREMIQMYSWDFFFFFTVSLIFIRWSLPFFLWIHVTFWCHMWCRTSFVHSF